MDAVSQFGCYFLLSCEPTVGSPVELQIALPAELPGLAPGRFLCHAKVVRIEKSLEEGKHRVLCSIERYRLIPAAADLEGEKENG